MANFTNVASYSSVAARRAWLAPIACVLAVTTGQAAAQITVVQKATGLKTLSPAPAGGDVLQTLGYYRPGDGGGETFRFVSNDDAPEDGGWVFEHSSGGRFHALDKTYADVKKFGAMGLKSGVPNAYLFDSAPRIQAAIDAAMSRSVYLGTNEGSTANIRQPTHVWFPHDEYRLARHLRVRGTGGNPHTGSAEKVRLLGDAAVLRSLDGYDQDQWALKLESLAHCEIRGLTWIGFRKTLQLGVAGDNIDFGTFDVERCRFIGREDDARRRPNDELCCLVQISSRSTVATFEQCVFDNPGLHFLEVLSCDRVRLNNCQFKLPDFLERRPPGQGYIRLVAGQLQAHQCLFTPPRKSYDNGSATELANPLSWIKAEGHPGPDVGSKNTATSFWCFVDLQQCHFGAEGGGLTILNWNQPAADHRLLNPWGFRIANGNLLGTVKEVGVADDGSTAVAPAVLLNQIPNVAIVCDNWFSGGKNVAMAFPRGKTPPAVFKPSQNKRCYVRVENNYGSQSPYWMKSGLGPNWIPRKLARLNRPAR